MADLCVDYNRISPPVRQRLQVLTKLDNWHGFLGILQEYALIAGSVALCLYCSWWFYPISVLLIGSSHRSLAHFLHESAHKVLAKDSRLNLVLGMLFSGYLIFQMYTPYRNTHIGCHHRRLGDPDEDPDYSFHQECGLYDHRQSDTAFIFRNIISALLGLRTIAYMRYLLRDRIFCTMPRLVISMPIRLHHERRILLAMWALLITLAALGSWLYLLLLFWFVPMFTTAIAIGWISELAEHYPLPESETKILLLTRNRHGWAAENFLLGRHSDRYHLVHHLNPGIPYWNLRRAHRVLMDDPGYAIWDGMWGGILTLPRSRRHAETVLSYGSKYRSWRRAGGDPRSGQTSFAELLTRTDHARKAVA